MKRICKTCGKTKTLQRRMECSKCRDERYKSKNPERRWAYTWVSRTKYKEGEKYKGFNITSEYLLKKLKQAKKKFPDLCFDKKSPNNISVDRIDSNKPYEKGNIQIIPMWLNMAKHNFDEEEIERIIIDYVNRVLLEVE